MSIQSEINRIIGFRDASLAAVAAKGVTVPSGSAIDDLPSLIAQIPTGGGSIGLTVVGGTTQPSNPDENTIWVNTSTEITSWCVQNTEPSSPSAGMVWITLKPSISNVINLSDSGTFLAGFGMSRQYVSGEWVIMDAYLFANSAWQELQSYLYNLGDTCIDFCGGWKHLDSGSNNRDEFLADNLHMNYTSTTGVNGAFVTEDMVDLTEYTKLCIDFSVSRGSTGSSYQSGIYRSTQNSSYSNYANNYTAIYTWHLSSKARGVVEVDITDITGSFYIGTRQQFSDCNIYRLWLEK